MTDNHEMTRVAELEADSVVLVELEELVVELAERIINWLGARFLEHARHIEQVEGVRQRLLELPTHCVQVSDESLVRRLALGRIRADDEQHFVRVHALLSDGKGAHQLEQLLVFRIIGSLAQRNIVQLVEVALDPRSAPT